MIQKTTKVKKMEISADLMKELDALVDDQKSGKRWSPEAEAILVHYYQETDATIGTLCKILEKAYPERDWPYTIVNSKIQYFRKLGCLDAGKVVD